MILPLDTVLFILDDVLVSNGIALTIGPIVLLETIKCYGLTKKEII